MAISQSNPKAFKNPWVLGFLTMFVVVVSMNSFFIYMAIKHPPNLVVSDYYERGEHYETQMAKELAHEKSLGWHGTLILPTKTKTNKSQLYKVELKDNKQAYLDMDTVVLYAYRPSNRKDDFSVDMQASKRGIYEADVSFHLPGTWDVIVEAHRGKDEFSIAKRIFISR